MNATSPKSISSISSREQNVFFITQTEEILFPWVWMNRAKLEPKLNRLTIYFTSKAVEIKGRDLSTLLSAISQGTVRRVIEINPFAPATASQGEYLADSVSVTPPDDDDEGDGGPAD